MGYDVCVIGAGWAGFNAALKAAKSGKSVCLIEEGEIGGTCLNRGCIPTKALLAYSKQGLTLPEIQKKKNDVVARLRQGMAYMLKTHKIDYVHGRALIEDPSTVSVTAAEPVKARFILLATGSEPRDLPGIPFDHEKVISSDDVLDLVTPPKSILIIGGGVIGCELACFFKRMGAQVTILEATKQLLPGVDAQISKKLEQALQKQGMTIRLDTKAEAAEFENFEKILLAVGRKSVVKGLWKDKVALKVEGGSISADRELKTSVPSIYGAGDCIGGYMLAHVASYEGELAADNMFASKAQNRDYRVIPASVFTSPEVGMVGISEEEARQFDVRYLSRTVHYLSVGMAHVLEDTQGFVKVIANEETGRILGAHVIGLQATELVNIFSVLMKSDIPVAGLRKTVFAHPSVSEIIAEVARAFD